MEVNQEQQLTQHVSNLVEKSLSPQAAVTLFQLAFRGGQTFDRDFRARILNEKIVAKEDVDIVLTSLEALTDLLKYNASLSLDETSHPGYTVHECKYWDLVYNKAVEGVYKHHPNMPALKRVFLNTGLYAFAHPGRLKDCEIDPFSDICNTMHAFLGSDKSLEEILRASRSTHNGLLAGLMDQLDNKQKLPSSKKAEYYARYPVLRKLCEQCNLDIFSDIEEVSVKSESVFERAVGFYKQGVRCFINNDFPGAINFFTEAATHFRVASQGGDNKQQGQAKAHLNLGRAYRKNKQADLIKIG